MQPTNGPAAGSRPPPYDRGQSGADSASQRDDDGRPRPGVTVPSVSLPKAGGAIRGIGEKFAANPVSGTGTLSVPIATSPGRAGFGPALALSYDSGSGNGPFGFGWSLSLPSITRKTDKGIPRYDDAHNSDVFVLSAAEDLVPVHGPAPQQPGYRVDRFRPRVEGLFARIERWTRLTDSDVHWRSVTRDNVTTWYGLDDGSRVRDPHDPARIFSWLICRSADDRGNAMVYEYASEDSAGVDTTRAHERHRGAADRTANRYVKRIRYGNRTSHLLDADLINPQWMFEVVFDYGDDDPGGWTCRDDPFSTYRAGFEVRTYRLCRRVLMLHHFPDEPDVGVDCLVASTDLNHQAGGAVGTFLTSVTHRGFRRDGDGYLNRSLPPVEFGYSPATLRAEVREVDAASLVHAPAGLADGYEFTDLDGEGIAGLLYRQTSSWFYKSNLGDARFAPARTVPRVPSLAGGRLMDLGGDGKLDLVRLAGPTSGFAELDTGQWQPFRSLPTVDWDDPNLRFADLDGDGLADVLVTEDDALVWYPSLGEAGFGAGTRVQAPRPRLVFADGTGSLQLADMSGDGQADLVRVRNGEVCYWPNLGHGRFGPKVVMDNAPTFDRPEAFDPRRLHLADIDGSGPTDLVYLAADGVQVHLNRSGDSWAAPVTLSPVPDLADPSAVSTVDLLGTGTTCLVWSVSGAGEQRRSLRYLDPLGGVKPHLLIRMANNLGAETQVEYAPSTQFYLRDKAAGRPWRTRLAFPVQVVERVTTSDRITGNTFVTRYAYHHGHFDGVEREFRGFGMVEQWDTDHVDGVAAPVLMKTWFHTGAFGPTQHFESEYWPGTLLLADTILPDASPEELREACRALRGQVLRQEVYALDGGEAQDRPYRVVESNYTMELLQPRRPGDRHAVWFVHPRETLSMQYERTVGDPRIAHDTTLEVDDYGNVLRTVSVAYPRRQPEADLDGLPDWARVALNEEQSRTHVILTVNGFTNAVDEPNAYRAPVACESRRLELTGVSTADRLLTVDEVRALADTGQRRLVDHTRTLLRADDLSGPLPLGTVQPRAVEYESYRLAFTAELLDRIYPGDRMPSAVTLPAEGGYVEMDGGWWMPSGRVSYAPEPTGGAVAELTHARAHFFQPRCHRDPFGNMTTVDFDGHDLLPVEARDPVGNRVVAGNDYRVLQPGQVTDPNGNRTRVAFDALGLVVATAVGGKADEVVGDSLDGVVTDPPDGDPGDPLLDAADRIGRATTVRRYDLHAYHRTRDSVQPQPPYVHTMARETHDAALAEGTRTEVQHHIAYSDGFGREIQIKALAEPGPAGERWVTSGWTVFDNKGRPVREYEPFFSATHRFELARTAGVSTVLCYDPIGRVVATLRPDDTYTKVVFDAWQQTTWDPNDTVLLDPTSDPDVRGFVGALSPDFQTWHARRAGGAFGAREQAAAAAAAGHAGTPTIGYADTLGRTFLTVQHNRVDGTDQQYATRAILDIEGNESGLVDARGRRLVARDHDLAGRPLRVVSADAGERVVLPDVAGQPIRTWDARGQMTRFTYDGLRRPLDAWVAAGVGPERLVARTEYGEAHPEAAERNLRTRPYRQFDSAGLRETAAVDFKGNVLRSIRRLALDYTGADPTAVAPEEFVTERAFDALNRPTLVSCADGSVVRPQYNEASLLVRLDAQLPDGGGQWTPFVTGIDYNAKGQRMRIGYGNGAETRYEHDPATFRRVAQVTSSPGVQALSYTYDPIGNLVDVRDDAQQTIFFAGAVVEPHAAYAYDAVYRLVAASGREHAGQLAPMWDDADWAGQPHPNDGQAMRRYTQRFSYDDVGNLLQMAHVANGGGWTRTYEYTEPSALDPTQPGNRLSAGRVGAGPAEPYSYDPNGNLLTLPHLAGLEWNHADRLSAVDRGGGGRVYYGYDAAGERVRKVVTRLNGTRASERIYLEGCEIYREYDGSGQVVTLARETLHVLDDIRRVAMVETRTVGADGSPPRLIRFVLDNHLGSAVLELDQTATVISYEEYHPFGTTAYQGVRGQVAPPKRYRFTGKERDEETGFYYHGARYYAPWLARWTSCDRGPDPFKDGPCVYAYARNNPTTYADPNGREARVTVDPATRTVTVATTVHLYGSTDRQVAALRNVAAKADRFWANPTVATQADVDAAAAANTPVQSRGLTANINGNNWTLKFEITHTVHRGKAPIETSTDPHTFYDIDKNRAAADNVRVGDTLISLQPNTAGAGIHKVGGDIVGLAAGADKSNATGTIKGPFATTSDQDALARRVIHEVGHAIGLDERYDPVTAGFATGGYPGFDYDAMAQDNGRERVLDPSHVSDYLTFGAALSAGLAAPKTFLVSGHIDDTKGGTLTPSDPTFAATQATARADAVTRTRSNTTAWDRAVATPTGTVSDLVPHVPVRDKPAPPPRAPARRGP